MSKRSRRRRRRARAERVGHSRGRGRRVIWLNPPGASSEEMLGRLLMCLPQPALESLQGHITREAMEALEDE